MIQQCLINDIDSIYNKVLNENLVVRKIDFEKDINKEYSKNSKYYIEPNEGYLKFLYAISKHEKKDIVMVSQDDLKRWDLHILPRKDSNGRAQPIQDDYVYYIYNTPLDKKQMNTLAMNLLEIDSPVYMVFCNYNYLNVIKDIINNKLIHNDDYNTIKGRISYIDKFNNWSSYYFGDKYKEDIINIPSNTSIARLIDIDEGIDELVDIFGRQKRLEVGIKLDFDKIFLVVVCKKATIDMKEEKMICEHINFVKKTGYIYLRKLELAFKSVRLAMFYTGNPILQYYDCKKEQWINVDINENISINSSLELRIKMCNGDTVKDILILKPKVELFKEYNVVHNIDFELQVDKNQSDIYVIDKDKKDLKFLYSTISRINYESILTVLGESIKEDNRIKLVPSNKHRNLVQTLSQKRCTILYNKSITNKEMDEVNFHINFHDEHTITKDMSVYVHFNNEYGYKYLKELASGKVIYGGEEAKSLERKTTSIEFNYSQRKIFIKTFKGDIIKTSKCISKLSSNTNEINCKVNFKEGYLIIGSPYIKIFNKELIFQEERFMSLMVAPESNEELKNRTDYSIYLTDGLCNKEEGYVYLSPIDLNESFKLQPLMFYRGIPLLEYHDFESNSWKEVNAVPYIDSEREILLRIKMSKNDTVNNLLLVQKR